MDRWIVIPNWEKLQHYGSRRDPPWFKTYISILHDDAYLNLSGHQRATLHGLWAMYAAAHRQVRDSTTTISRQLNLRVTRATLDALNHAGLLEFSASAPLAERYHDASPRALARGEESRKDTPLPPPEGETSSRAKGTNPRAVWRAKEDQERQQLHDRMLAEAEQIAASWNGSNSDTFDQTLDELEHRHQQKLAYKERDRLWTAAFSKRHPTPDVEEDPF